MLSANATCQSASVRLKDAVLTKQQRRDVYKVTGPDDGDGTPENPWMSVEEIKLSKDHTRQIAVVTFEGMMGNESTQIFMLTKNHAVLILSDDGGMWPVSPAQVHHGMLDVASIWKYGGSNFTQAIYQFDGKQYHPVYCTDITRDENGVDHEGPHFPCKGPSN
jgi:hypothetical protein